MELWGGDKRSKERGERQQGKGEEVMRDEERKEIETDI
jgi:hypothetical protein